MQIGRMRDDLVEAILQANPDPVWIVDGDGEVIASNQAFARWRTTVSCIELALNRLFSSEESLRELLPRALEFLCTAEQWEAAIVWLAYEDEAILRAAGSWFASGETAKRLRPRIAGLAIPRGRGVPGRAWAQGDVVWIADILDEGTLHRGELAAAAGLHCVVAVPLPGHPRFTVGLELFAAPLPPLSERRQ